MKLTTLLLVIALLQVSAKGFSQITLKETNAPLKTVLKKIKAQSGCYFVYENSLIEGKKVTVQLNDVSLPVALDQIFKNTELGYDLVEKTVVIKTSEATTQVKKIEQPAPRKDISGRVVDEKGVPIPGANVRVKDGYKGGGTSTDEKGRFTLKGVDDNAILVITFIGYDNLEISGNYSDFDNVVMKQSNSKLDEVQIQAYGVTSRRLSTGNIATVKAAEIAMQPINNPLLALQGRIPGLIVGATQGNSPLQMPKLQLRGQNSLGSVTQPLIIVDGLPVKEIGAGGTTGTIFNMINPVDIESIDVLKDADATSIYGSRGANGVILITTKKGKAGHTEFNGSISQGVSQVTRYLDLMNTQEYLAMRKQAFMSDGLTLPTIADANNSNYDLTVWNQNRYTDWQKFYMGKAARQTNGQMSINGGSELVQYFISGRYAYQDLVTPGDNPYKQGGGHMSLTFNSSNKKFEATILGDYGSNSLFTSGNAGAGIMFLAPNAPSIYNSNGQLNWEPQSLNGPGTWKNPLAGASINYKEKMSSYKLATSYKVLPALELKFSGGFYETNSTTFQASPITLFDPYIQTSSTRSASYKDNNSSSWTVDPQIWYHTHIGKGKLEFVTAGNIQKQTYKFNNVTARGFADDLLLQNRGSAKSWSSSNTSSQYSYVSLSGRLSYNWEDKYIIATNFRRDGSSRFGPDHQYGNFASLSGAWIFSNEHIIKDLLTPLSFGKIRASYGTSGNDGIIDYRYLSLYATPDINDPSTYNGVRTLNLTGISNPDYHWESVKKIEYGIDLGFINDRLLISADYFRNRSDDQLGSSNNLPLTAGRLINTDYIQNQSASIQNSGWEFSLNSVNIKTKDFNWNTSINMGFQENKLLKLPNDVNGNPDVGVFIQSGLRYSNYYNPIGKQFSDIAYVYEYRGIDNRNGLYQFTAADDKSATSDPFHDLYFSTVSTLPKYTIGLNNSLSFKGITLSLFFEYRNQISRNYIFDAAFMTNSLVQSPGGFYSTNSSIPFSNQPKSLRTWTSPNVNADYQVLTTQNFDTANQWGKAYTSNLAYVDASYLRLRTASLSYKLSPAWLKGAKIRSLTFNLNCQNVFLLTSYKGKDPEIQSEFSVPQLRTVVAGLNVGF